MLIKLHVGVKPLEFLLTREKLHKLNPRPRSALLNVVRKKRGRWYKYQSRVIVI